MTSDVKVIHRTKTLYDVFWGEGWWQCVTVRVVGSGPKKRSIMTCLIDGKPAPIPARIKSLIESWGKDGKRTV